MSFEQVLQNPGAVYGNPAAVLQDPDLNDEEKLKILNSWEVDAREVLKAEEENMSPSDSTQSTDILQQINDAQRELRGQS